MSIIWDLVGSLLSSLPFEKIWRQPVTKSVGTTLVLYSNDPAHEMHFKELVERNPRFNDPVYKKNVQKLIERNRKLEEARE